MTSLLDTIEDFQSTTDLDEKWKKLHKSLAEFGISGIFYGVCEISQTNEEGEGFLSKMIHRTSYPKAFLDYFDTRYIDDDFTTEHCLSKTSPIHWHDKQILSNLTGSQREVALEGANFNMDVGVSIPVRFNEHGAGGVGCAAESLSAKDFGEMWQSKGDTITSIVSAFDQSFREDFATKELPLTLREKEVLTWLSVGYQKKK